MSKWDDPFTPKRGWRCVGVEDLGEASAICEMCETREIRYVHEMEHPRHAGTLRVGCVCAGHMEGNAYAPQEREKGMRRQASRRSRWLTRRWRTSARGNDFLNTDGFNIVVHEVMPGWWGFHIREREGDGGWRSRRAYATADEAKLGTFDTMIFLRGQGFGHGPLQACPAEGSIDAGGSPDRTGKRVNRAEGARGSAAKVKILCQVK